MTNPIDDLAADIRELDGNNDLGAAALAEALVAKGWVKGEPAPEDRPLKDYKVNDKVIVLDRDLLRREGVVRQVDPVSFHVHVHTEKGPITIATPRRNSLQ